MKNMIYVLATLAIVVVGCGKDNGSNSNSTNCNNTYGSPYGGYQGGYQPGYRPGYPGGPRPTPYTNGYGHSGHRGGHPVNNRHGNNYRYGTTPQPVNNNVQSNYRADSYGNCIDVRRNTQVSPSLCKQNYATAPGTRYNNNGVGFGANADCGYGPGYGGPGYGGPGYGGPGYGFGGYSPFEVNGMNDVNNTICSKFDNLDAGTYALPVYFPGTNQVLCVEYTMFNQYATTYGYGTPQYMPGYNNVYQGCIPGVNVPANCNCSTMGGNIGPISAGVYAGVCF